MTEASKSGDPGRSPVFLIMVPLLILIGVALVFSAIASGQRRDANAAVDAALEGGMPIELCGGEADAELNLDRFDREQPLVLSSVTLDRAAVSFVAPAEGEADASTADDNEPLVDVILLELEDQSSGWCIATWETSTRLAAN